MSTTIAGVVVLLLILFWVVGAYTRLLGLRRQFKQAFPPIAAQLTQRYDLIPALVETARGWMKQEREALETVIDARNRAAAAHAAALADPGDADAVRMLGHAHLQLEAALEAMFTLGAAYPELKADQNMTQLTAELTAIADRLTYARQAYNDCATAYNDARAQFPVSLVAAVFAFPPAQPFEHAESGRGAEAPGLV